MVLVFFLVYILHGFRLPIPHQTYPPLFFHTTAPVAFAGSFVATTKTFVFQNNIEVVPSHSAVILSQAFGCQAHESSHRGSLTTGFLIQG